WAILAAFAPLALLAIKINALFVYATAITFFLVLVLVRTIWRRPAIALRSGDAAAEISKRRQHAKRRVVRGNNTIARRSRRLPWQGLPLAVWLGFGAGAMLGIAFVLFEYGITADVNKSGVGRNLRDMWRYFFGQLDAQQLTSAMKKQLLPGAFENLQKMWDYW